MKEVKTMRDGNIFREAQQLLRDKPILEINGEQLITVKAALIPLDILPEFNKKTVDEGLEELAKIWDEARGEPDSVRQQHKEGEPATTRQQAG